MLNQNNRNVCDCCLEVHDLARAKLAASLSKDLEFVAALANCKSLDPGRLASKGKITTCH